MSSSANRWKDYVDHPTQLDICCGRGKRYLSHPGNILFQSLVKDSVYKYSVAPTKVAKSEVVASIVDELLLQGARFLKRDEKLGRWYRMSPALSRDKTGHAIRDLLNQQKRKQTSTGSVTSSTASVTTATALTPPKSHQVSPSQSPVLVLGAPGSEIEHAHGQPHVISVPSSPQDSFSVDFDNFEHIDLIGDDLVEEQPVNIPPLSHVRPPTTITMSSTTGTWTHHPQQQLPQPPVRYVQHHYTPIHVTTPVPPVPSLSLSPSGHPFLSHSITPVQAAPAPAPDTYHTPATTCPEPHYSSEVQHLAISQLREDWSSDKNLLC
eukprot:Nitzschia sp. Nitz4//scaffold30_size153850//13522//14487//NITZ4_002758-RA/size153850-processed-gene-0.2-mRNA-1//1//CDS//3329547202//8407//frame0